LVLFVRIGAFQWVTANPNKKSPPRLQFAFRVVGCGRSVKSPFAPPAANIRFVTFLIAEHRSVDFCLVQGNVGKFWLALAFRPISDRLARTAAFGPWGLTADDQSRHLSFVAACLTADVEPSSPVGLRLLERASSTATAAASSGVAHSSGSPALLRASRKLGSVSTQAELCARNDAKDNLGFNFIASARAAFACGALSAAA
jgi:hypothetical protein